MVSRRPCALAKLTVDFIGAGLNTRILRIVSERTCKFTHNLRFRVTKRSNSLDFLAMNKMLMRTILLSTPNVSFSHWDENTLKIPHA